ncbi:Ribosomal RNA small subunit methyltransferase I [Buchnera aphidicola (Thelaxes suberi)]|uniref:16S rRNA (cytidine(1402)-2'-O)-methyltransferase n=1 Tax=Buchnera aphidicola TaxID=9 RepID=UPI003463B248
MNLSHKTGKLYIVPTPIGNLNDITKRALEILKKVDLIIAEDTRHTKILLRNYNIHNNLTCLHKYNENKKTKNIIKYIQTKKHVALVSNAGTPIINDPGFYLLKQCILFKNIEIIPIPGACAIITALIASGLPTNRFCYEGFLPSNKSARKKILELLKNETRTMIFFESPNRLTSTLIDIKNIFGENRNIVIAKELTKIWELIQRLPVLQMLKWISNNNNILKGEFIILIQGCEKPNKQDIKNKIFNTFNILKKVLNEKEAALYTTKIHAVKKNYLYEFLFKKNMNNLI